MTYATHSISIIPPKVESIEKYTTSENYPVIHFSPRPQCQRNTMLPVISKKKRDNSQRPPGRQSKASVAHETAKRISTRGVLRHASSAAINVRRSFRARPLRKCTACLPAILCCSLAALLGRRAIRL